MVRITIDDIDLCLPDGFELELSCRNTAFDEDELTNPVAIGVGLEVDGNEKTLGRYTLPGLCENIDLIRACVSKGSLNFPDAGILPENFKKRDGKWTGDVTIGFNIIAQEFNNTKWSELNLGTLLVKENGEGTFSEGMIAWNEKEEKVMRFPPFFNPDQFGDNNPLFAQEESDDNPDPINPCGMINAYDDQLEIFMENDGATTFGEWAIAPWFHLTYLLRRTFAVLGYNIKGGFLEDPKICGLLVANCHTLDNFSPNEFCVEYSGYADTIFALDHDFGNELTKDATEAYNNSQSDGRMQFIFPSAGVYRICVDTEFPLENGEFVRLRIQNGGTMIFPAVDLANGQLCFNFDITAADVGVPIDIYIFHQNADQNSALIIPVEVSIEAVSGAGFNTFQGVVTIADHVPCMTISELLNQLKRCFALQIDIDDTSRTICLDFIKDKLDERPRDARDLLDDFDIMRSEAKYICFQNEFKEGALLGVDFAYDLTLSPVEGTAGDPDKMDKIIYNTIDHSVWRSTRKADGSYEWKFLGYRYDEEMCIGPEDGEKTDIDGCPITPMRWKETDMSREGFVSLPYFEKEGNSSAYGNDSQQEELCLINWHGILPPRPGVASFRPFATTHNENYLNQPLTGIDLLQNQQEDGVFKCFLEPWWLQRIHEEKIRWWELRSCIDAWLDRKGMNNAHGVCIYQEEMVMVLDDKARGPVQYEGLVIKC